MLLRRIVQHKSPTLLFPQCRAGVGRRGLPSNSLPPRRYNGAVAAAKASANVNQQSGEGERNPNEGILDMLRLELREEERKGQPNVFRINAFAKAIDTISRIEETIKSGDDYVLEVQGIGIGIKNRINLYFVQQDLDAAYNEEQREDAVRRGAVMELQKVPGIGRVKAKALAAAGCRDMEDLLSSEQYHSILTPQLITCLKYVKHLDKTTSREEAERILNEVTKWLPSQYEAVLVGEYRRGTPDISNIDMMLLHRDFVHVPMPTDPPAFPIPSSSPSTSSYSPPSFEPFWDSVEPSPEPSSSTSSSSTAPTLEPDSTSPATPKRRSKHIIKKRERKAGLTKAAREASLLHNQVIPCLRSGDVMCETLGETVHTWTGVVRLPPPPHAAETPTEEEEDGSEPRVALCLQTPVGVKYRRVTFHLVPQKSRPTALLALTGDDELNRYMWKKAERQGMLLDEYGLWKWNTSGGSSTEGLEGPPSSIEASGSSEPVEAPDEEATPGGYWGLVTTPTEEAVFKELGMRYIPPEKRNWGFVSGAAKLRPTKKKFSTSFVGS